MFGLVSGYAQRDPDGLGRWLDAHGGVDANARELLATATTKLQLSARGYHRVLKVARTIADLDGDAGVLHRHVAEALHYRTDQQE